MNETRIEQKINEEEALKKMREMIESYNPENETMVVIKVSGSIFDSNTTVGSTIFENHLVGLLNAFKTLTNQNLKAAEERNPLKAALISASLEEQKND